jgi:hypothetical protein
MTATVDAHQATQTEIADLMLLTDLMAETEQLMEVVTKHGGRPYANHLRRILTAYSDAVEFLAGMVQLPDDEAGVAP